MPGFESAADRICWEPGCDCRRYGNPAPRHAGGATEADLVLESPNHTPAALRVRLDAAHPAADVLRYY